MDTLELTADGIKRTQFLHRLQGEITKRGVVDVLRKGVSHGPVHVDLYKLLPTPGNAAAADAFAGAASCHEPVTGVFMRASPTHGRYRSGATRTPPARGEPDRSRPPPVEAGQSPDEPTPTHHRLPRQHPRVTHDP